MTKTRKKKAVIPKDPQRAYRMGYQRGYVAGERHGLKNGAPPFLEKLRNWTDSLNQLREEIAADALEYEGVVEALYNAENELEQAVALLSPK